MRLRISLAILLVVAVLVACAAPVPTPTPTPRPTATVAPTATPTATPTPVPTPVGAADVRPSGGEPEWLRPFEAEAGSVSVAAFEAANLGLKLLVPEGAAAQAFVQFQKNGQTLALGNFNLPVFKEGQVKFPPVFNTPDFGFLMGWVDNEGNWLYHIPLQPGVEGKAPVVYQKGDTLYEGLVDLQTGKIDPTTERPYWVVMPLQAVKAVLAKYQDAIYITFWDKDGKQLEAERIKVCDLPPEPTPTPERPIPEIKPLDLPGLDEVWNSQNGRWEYVDIDKQVAAYWDAEQKKVEITATTLTEKHLGLFAPVSPQEAQRLFDQNFVDTYNFDFVFPVDISQCRERFLLTLFKAEGDNQQVFSLELPRGAKFVAPMRAVANDVSWSTNETINLYSVDKKSNFLTVYMGGGKLLVPSKTMSIVGAGTVLMEVVDPLARLNLIGVPGTEKYNALIVAGMGFSLDFKDLIRDKSGRILYLQQ